MTATNVFKFRWFQVSSSLNNKNKIYVLTCVQYSKERMIDVSVSTCYSLNWIDP